ncbi:MAG: tannase [Stomatobaculum sp.]|nr:tannase [Stomatobaculum sp.]MBR7058152.1 tannase [Stomatobaculum sp.]
MRRHSGKNIAAAAALVTMLILSSCGSAAGGGAAGTSGAAGSGGPGGSGSAAEETSASAGAGAGQAAGTGASDSAKKELTTEVIEGLPMVDMTKWQYNAEDDVYWQVGIPYCASPADEKYETMGLFVPGAYFAGTDNGDGTWTCEKEDNAECGGYIADTAPMILPVNTPGYSAMSAPESYDSNFGYGSVTDYTKEGMVLAVAGCRGREHGAPAGVTDLKAAIRFLRYNNELLPGDANSLFCCGMSGGGAQSAVLGASGDSELYTPYLEQIGAARDYSDAVLGAMCWCPITSLDMADAAYEWNLGGTREGLTEEEQRYSDGLAAAFADYINSLGLTGGDGQELTLEESGEGVWQAGSYADYMKGVVQESLNHFLEDTEFPYNADNAGGHGGMGGPGGHGGPGGQGAPDGQGAPGAGNAEGGDYAQMDNITRKSYATAAVSLSGTYETPADYIAALNEPFTWVKYDEASNTAEITSMADFCKAMKVASKGLGAFDQLDRGQGENTLFGYGDGAGAHFDRVLAGLAAGTEYEAAFAEDLEKKDAAGNQVQTRVDMYNPLYYFLDHYDGSGSSEPAGYWRIRSGICQGDTALTTETNLALAIASYGPGYAVDFETVWGMGHTMAERKGESTANFIAWVRDCMGGNAADKEIRK